MPLFKKLARVVRYPSLLNCSCACGSSRWCVSAVFHEGECVPDFSYQRDKWHEHPGARALWAEINGEIRELVTKVGAQYGGTSARRCRWGFHINHVSTIIARGPLTEEIRGRWIAASADLAKALRSHGYVIDELVAAGPPSQAQWIFRPVTGAA